MTTHKIDLLAAASDLFDALGPYAQTRQEVSSTAKDDGKLVGRATDPVAGGLSVGDGIGPGQVGGSGGHLLIFGAGGSAVALTLHVIQKCRCADRPERIVVVNRSAARLARLRLMVEGVTGSGGPNIQFSYIQNSVPKRNDEILAGLPAGSVVINATGMGKDTPGSLLCADAPFPHHGVIWELNYGGELDIMRQAETQQAARSLTVADGWDYFTHGWAQVNSHVLQVKIDPFLFAHLSELAELVR